MKVQRRISASGEKAGRRSAVSAAIIVLGLLLAASCVLALPGCASSTVESEGGDAAAGMTAQDVLERSVERFVALQSYRYRGTSSLTVSGIEAASNESQFDIVLEKNEQGAMDGHMVVTSEKGSGSYETYSYRGCEYTRMQGGEWYRVEMGSSTSGYGMVSLDARRIIAEFADLVEDVRFEGETATEYIISMIMGPAYFKGAAEIVGSDANGAGASGSQRVSMTITVDKETLDMTSVSMTETTEPGTNAPAVTIVTEGTYSELNQPVDIEPPPEALSAPLMQQ